MGVRTNYYVEIGHLSQKNNRLPLTNNINFLFFLFSGMYFFEVFILLYTHMYICSKCFIKFSFTIVIYIRFGKVNSDNLNLAHSNNKSVAETFADIKS